MATSKIRYEGKLHAYIPIPDMGVELTNQGLIDMITELDKKGYKIDSFVYERGYYDSIENIELEFIKR